MALDSQGVIQRIWNLQFDLPWPWIEEVLAEQMKRRPRTLMWVREEKGNQEADASARMEVEVGWGMQRTVIATPAGIKQEFPIYPKMPAHLRWSPRALRGLVYMVTGKGPAAVAVRNREIRNTLVCV